ncbi:MFS transporter [Microbacterium sp. 18062]|uniref:MFS transporter n=1 Tax=Microbacterium sp. 18062 TaxID=2681410 RepID=UPI0013590F3B|nr:MFS transporter [Microbacterium sp. 18062]
MGTRQRRTLSRSASFGLVAVVLALSLWASGAPAMVYPVYLDQWHATPLLTTALFATYPVALVLALILFGSLSDVIGRRRVILAGMILVACGTLVFVAAGSMAWLFAGRVLQGVGVGVALSAAAAALAEFDRSGRVERVSAVNTVATSSGAALAILAGGGLVQYSPAPATAPFVVLLVVVLAVIVGAWFLPESARTGTPWRPARPALPSRSRGTFFVGALTVASAFIMGGVFLALGAQIARDLVGSDNALLTGAVLATWPIAGIPAAVIARRVSARSAALGGGVLAAVGSLMLLPAGSDRSLGLFLAASIISGLGYGLLFSSGFGKVSASATVPHRAGNLAAMYLVVYLAQAGGAVGIGALATGRGLAAALAIGMPVIALLCLGAAVANLSTSDGGTPSPPSLDPEPEDAH